MRYFFSSVLGGRLVIVLVVAFFLVSALMGVLTTLVTARVIDEYLATDESERVARDMKLADAFYRLSLDEIAGLSYRMAQDPRVIPSLPAVCDCDLEATQNIDRLIAFKLTVPTVTGTKLLAVLDAHGNIVAGRTTSPAEEGLSPIISQGNWGELPIVQDALSSGLEQAGTEIIPAKFLAQVGLDKPAYSELIDTPQAAPSPFDPREGTAGLTLIDVYPLRAADGRVYGAVLAMHLLNNDSSLVDEITEVAGIDTATIFLGDLRVSTNVQMQDGRRAVGTRMSQNVRQVALEQNRDFAGRAYVVSDWFFTHYEPLRDHRGQLVGVLYVGARESAFLRLVNSFHGEVASIAVLCLALTGLMAVPVARAITSPITDLVQANRRLAQGDMTVRVQTHGGGELAMLGRSFNSMVETLDRTEQELMHKEKLAAMGQLAAGVAHEINNPLGSILLFADVMDKDLPERDPRRDDIQMIIRETTRCKNIVANLLNFARQQEVLAQETDVHALLDQVIEGVRYQPIFKDVEIVRRLCPDLPPIQADPGQLQEVFTNLLDNGAEAMNGYGTLSLNTRRINHLWVEITVADTGCGIAAENLGKIFTPFFTTKPPGKGTGLGLSIVYGIVKMHRGQVTVQSRVGQGTSFTVTLPMGVTNGGPEGKSNPAGAMG